MLLNLLLKFMNLFAHFLFSLKLSIIPYFVVILSIIFFLLQNLQISNVLSLTFALKVLSDFSYF